jgi:preprotein translocase subunit SecY
MKRYLARYIKTAAVGGGMFLGFMCLVSDMMCPMASGTGIVLGISIIYQFLEQIAKEKERGQDTMFF